LSDREQALFTAEQWLRVPRRTIDWDTS